MFRRFNVAPMMGRTDRHCRHLLRLLSPNAMLYSEMLTTGALIHGDRDRMLAHQGDEPAAVQLGGNNPDNLAACAKFVEEAGYQEVNLNCGCPSDRVQQGGIGACLMAEPARVAECFAAMTASVSIPVSVKCRIGIGEDDNLEFFEEFIRKVYDAGCRHFQIHARRAILTGLSPKENREIPPLRYDFVKYIQSAFADARFVLNGGIKTLEEVHQHLMDFPGVMLGRAIYDTPYLAAEIDQALFNTRLPGRSEVLDQYRQYMLKEMQVGTQLRQMAKHLLGLFAGIPHGRSFRRHLSTFMHRDDADIDVLDSAVACIGDGNR